MNWSATMSPTTRRVVQAILYEIGAVSFVGPALSWGFDQPVGESLALALLMSAIALGWNYVFNALFEAWEARQAVKGRSARRRLAHGIGFEGGLAILLVPLAAWWLQTTLLAALLAELVLLAFFFVYAIVFTWAFDRVFGLPRSAGGAA
ncbi:PACE efflux transporter [Rubrivivax sp. JA1024]|nr:PACE efflux transporter [Rubrivivax sp. JA1024]